MTQIPELQIACSQSAPYTCTRQLQNQVLNVRPRPHRTQSVSRTLQDGPLLAGAAARWGDAAARRIESRRLIVGYIAQTRLDEA